MTTKLGDVRSAALYINNMLVSKGYIRDDERLDFPSLDQDDDDDFDETETENREPSQSRVNDIRVINAIYSLMNTIDSDSSANENNMRQVSEIKREQEKERQQYERMKNQLTSMEKQVGSLTQLNTTMEASLKTAEQVAFASRESSNKLKYTLKQTRQQFATELRKRDVQIAKLKERIQDTRRTKTLSGVSGTLSKSYNSYSTSSASLLGGGSSGGEMITSGALTDEIVSMNRALVEENNALHDLLLQIRESVSSITRGTSGQLSEYSNKHTDSIAGVTAKTTNAQDLGAEISKTIETISEILNSPNFVSLSDMQAKEEEVRSLREQLNETTEAWQKAVSTMEEWKKYKEKRETSKQPRMLRMSSSSTRLSETAATKPSTPRKSLGSSESSNPSTPKSGPRRVSTASISRKSSSSTLTTPDRRKTTSSITRPQEPSFASSTTASRKVSRAPSNDSRGIHAKPRRSVD